MQLESLFYSHCVPWHINLRSLFSASFSIHYNTYTSVHKHTHNIQTFICTYKHICLMYCFFNNIHNFHFEFSNFSKFDLPTKVMATSSQFSQYRQGLFDLVGSNINENLILCKILHPNWYKASPFSTPELSGSIAWSSLPQIGHFFGI